MIYAHSLEGRPKAEWESLFAHSKRVGAAASMRANPAGLAETARLLGELHDLGKIKPGFQARLHGPAAPISHSGEGARILNEQGGTFGKILAGCIAGHHGRLPNPDTLARRLAEAEPIALPDWLPFTKPAPPARLMNAGDALAFRAQFLTRFLYGCLTDADDRETAAFFREAKGRPETTLPQRLTPAHQTAFDAHMARLSKDGLVNALRAEVLTHVRAGADQSPGLFTLTVPTGGGKTLASLGFGLDHAMLHGMERLIYVIPYQSIVEQTADVFRHVLGHEAVLEQHAAFDWDGVDETEVEQRRVAGASWDVPVVVTTAVQFFESLYAARKKRCRKLPSLARSVIVIDEAQTLPRIFLRPCLAALSELMDGYGASVVLCTATQPALTREAGFPAPEALVGARELAPNPARLYAALRRVKVRDIGAQTDDDLAQRLREATQALLIVDNRTQARRLFDQIRTEQGAAHLSTLMTAEHRRAVLADIRARLKGEAPVRLVSTSLIEAGVDIDFPLVLRSATGIDSLAQAAGRCNREGKLQALGEMLVFRSEHPAPPVVEDYAAKGRDVLARHPDDPLSLDAVADYFALLWRSYGAQALDAAPVGQGAPIAGILQAIKHGGMACPFEDIERAFQLIPDGQRSVVIRDGRYGVGDTTLQDLRFGSPGAAARALQRYTVSIPPALYRKLWDAHALAWWATDRFGEQFAMLTNSTLYDDAAGLAVDQMEELGRSIY